MLARADIRSNFGGLRPEATWRNHAKTLSASTDLHGAETPGIASFATTYRHTQLHTQHLNYSKLSTLTSAFLQRHLLQSLQCRRIQPGSG